MVSEPLLGFIIVAMIGYFIVFGNKNLADRPLVWCEVGKALLLWAVISGMDYAIKGPISKMSLVTGGNDYWGDYADEEPAERGLGNLNSILESNGGGCDIASNIM